MKQDTSMHSIKWASAYSNQIALFTEPPEAVPPPMGHYDGYKVAEFIESQGLLFAEGCVVKYVCRFKKKDGLKDLLKAKDYLDRIIAFNYPEYNAHSG